MRALVIAPLLLLFLSVGVGARPHSVGEIARADRLLALLDQRLLISEDVARAKWTSGAAIEDPAREKAVVEGFVTQAQAAGVDAEFAQQFILAQIEASKVRQRELFARWKHERQPPFANPPDLPKDIRPRLDTLSAQLIESLLETGPLCDSLLPWRAGVLWGNSLDPARGQTLTPFARTSPHHVR